MIDVLVVVAAVGCGAVGGAFYAFSTFVMAGLRRLPAAQGIAAMQAINATAVTPPFMVAFIGTALVCVALVVTAASNTLILVGSVLYLAGTFVETIVFHVPRNNALAEVAPTGPGAEEHWRRYLREWVAGNHVRTLFALAALVVFVLACGQA